jgi:hypothetical protein
MGEDIVHQGLAHADIDEVTEPDAGERIVKLPGDNGVLRPVTQAAHVNDGQGLQFRRSDVVGHDRGSIRLLMNSAGPMQRSCQIPIVR